MNYKDLILSYRPVAYLPLDEPSGQLIDITGNGYNADVYGTLERASTRFTAGGCNGLYNTAIGSGYAIIPKPMPHFGAHDFTVVAWMAGGAPLINSFGAAYGWESRPIVSQSTDAAIKRTSATTQIGTTHSWAISMTRSGNPEYVRVCYEAPHANAWAYTPNSAIRDDPNLAYGVFAWQAHWEVSFVTSTAFPKSLVAIRRNLNSLNSYNAYESIRDGVVQQTAGGDSPIPAPPSTVFGPGIFCHPTSKTTGSVNSAFMWINHLAFFDRSLSDADLLRMYTLGNTGVLAENRVSGSVLVDGVAVGNVRVNVHRRDTGAVLGTVLSDNAGFFDCYVGSYSGHVYAVAIDTVSGKNYNAQVFDLITPAL